MHDKKKKKIQQVEIFTPIRLKKLKQRYKHPQLVVF